MTDSNQKQIIALVVEDQMGMRKIIKTVLHHIGVDTVLEATDGLDALNQLRARNTANRNHAPSANQGFQPAPNGKAIDLIVCDWMMPKMNGMDLLRNVRLSKVFGTLPFIMLTAENEREQIVSAIEHRVTDYIVKPFTPKLLEEKIRHVLKGIGSSTHTQEAKN